MYIYIYIFFRSMRSSNDCIAAVRGACKFTPLFHIFFKCILFLVKGEAKRRKEEDKKKARRLYIYTAINKMSYAQFDLTKLKKWVEQTKKLKIDPRSVSGARLTRRRRGACTFTPRVQIFKHSYSFLLN